VIRAYDYDPGSGRLSNSRIFHRLVEGTGLPDGSTVDAEGGLWNARWQGHRVVRHRPDGSVDRAVELPVPNVTCVALGGPDLDTLYITTARQGLSDAALEAAPSAGGLFAVPAGVRGLPEPIFLG
jgi:L-arabinonolactonase